MTEIPSWVQKSKVGDKVVCVETWMNEEGHGYGHEVGPIEGFVYTIREIGPGVRGEMAFRLVEIINPKKNYKGYPSWEPMWRWDRFKPLTQKPTDISIFTDMLISKKECLPA